MQKRLLLYLFLTVGFVLPAQVNLVQNGSFEDYYTCPEFQPAYPINYCKYWYSPSKNTPDYMNTCTTDPLSSVPYSYFGYQQPKSGEGYAGFWLYGSGSSRDYLTNRLSVALQKDTLYCLQFYICRSNLFYTQTAIDRIQVNFSNDSIWYDTFFSLPVTPQLESQPGYFLTDTVNWIEISLPYTAQGGEQYLTIGNFRDDANTDTVKLVPIVANNGYYLIDDVSLVECNPPLPPKPFLIPDVFSPNNDGVNDSFSIQSLPANSQLIVYNRWGNRVYTSTNYQNNWDGANCADGVYYYMLTPPGGNTIKGTITIFR